MINVSNDWKDYRCLSSGGGEKIEKWGDYILRRPDPQIIWNKSNIKHYEKFFLIKLKSE